MNQDVADVVGIDTFNVAGRDDARQDRHVLERPRCARSCHHHKIEVVRRHHTIHRLVLHGAFAGVHTEGQRQHQDYPCPYGLRAQCRGSTIHSPARCLYLYFCSNVQTIGIGMAPGVSENFTDNLPPAIAPLMTEPR